ncbi:hypothetical protein OX284_011690 [Flavobacterium sp. SUN046]|uniref:hypothetical protein n=1 Tax=Flavobacterium sp. SUN046 TaxID=3002440 RepID=UPI002DC04599|nr:hypothetical protein [Flavobacterium sp. SUN046]MEC4050095.1 hypothetical protein [Flavobacterium sp. SUN046]
MESTTNLLDHSFISLITKAEHKVVVKNTEEESTITKLKLEYNGFSTVDDFKDELIEKLEYYLESLHDEISIIQFKGDRIIFFSKILKDLENIKLKVFKFQGENIVGHSAYRLNNELNDSFYSQNESSMCIDFIKAQHDYLNKCIENIKQERLDLDSLTQEDIDRTYGTSSSDISKCLGIKKIKTSLTVQELAFFFRILKDANIFDPNAITDFAKVSSEIFSSKKKDLISQQTFMKEYHKTAESLHDVSLEFLVNILPKLKEISEKYKNSLIKK